MTHFLLQSAQDHRNGHWALATNLSNRTPIEHTGDVHELQYVSGDLQFSIIYVRAAHRKGVHINVEPFMSCVLPATEIFQENTLEVDSPVTNLCN